MIDLFYDYISIDGADSIFKSYAIHLCIHFIELIIRNKNKNKKMDEKSINRLLTQIRELDQQNFFDLDFIDGKEQIEEKPLYIKQTIKVDGQNECNNRITIGIKRSIDKIKHSIDKIMLSLDIDDLDIQNEHYFKVQLNAFWHLFNILQFLSMFIGRCKSGIDNDDYSIFSSHDQEPIKESIQPQQNLSSDNWDDIRELVVSDPSLDKFISFLEKQKIPKPSDNNVGYEFEDQKTKNVVAEAELFWPNLQICYLTFEQEEFKDILEKMSIKVITSKTTEAEILKLFGGEHE